MTNQSNYLFYLRKKTFSHNLFFVWAFFKNLFFSRFSWHRLFRFIVNNLKKSNKEVKGFKIKFKGKLRAGKIRKRILYRNYGKIRTSIFNSEVKYLSKIIYNFHGAFGFKIWLLLKKQKKKKHIIIQEHY